MTFTRPAVAMEMAFVGRLKVASLKARTQLFKQALNPLLGSLRSRSTAIITLA